MSNCWGLFTEVFFDFSRNMKCEAKNEKDLKS